MMEEEEEGQYDDITKYEEASSEDEQSRVVTEEPKSNVGQTDYVPGQPSEPSEEKTEFAKSPGNGYDSITKTESESVPKTEGTASPTENKEESEPSGPLLDKSD